MPIPDHVKNKLTVGRATVRSAVTGDPTLQNVTDAEIDSALATVDQTALYDGERAAWTTVVWDKVSPINGVPAEHFLDRDDVDENGDDDIYLLIRGDQVIGFQPHQPDQEGLVRIPKGQGVAVGTRHADAAAADRTAAEVVLRVRSAIAAKRGATPK